MILGESQAADNALRGQLYLLRFLVYDRDKRLAVGFQFPQINFRKPFSIYGVRHYARVMVHCNAPDVPFLIIDDANLTICVAPIVACRIFLPHLSKARKLAFVICCKNNAIGQKRDVTKFRSVAMRR